MPSKHRSTTRNHRQGAERYVELVGVAGSIPAATIIVSRGLGVRPKKSRVKPLTCESVVVAEQRWKPAMWTGTTGRVPGECREDASLHCRSRGGRRLMDTVLVTGGAGYVGSHTCKGLRARGFEPVVYDDLCRGQAAAVRWGPLEKGCVTDRDALRTVLERHRPVGVFHFAGLADVAESMSDPAAYYRTNVGGMMALLDAVRGTGVRNLIFQQQLRRLRPPNDPCRSPRISRERPSAPTARAS